MRIFVTGASGCIGHYLIESLIKETDHELFLLVRNPEKLKFDPHSRPGIHVLSGNLREIEKLDSLLKTINVAILTAASWGGVEDTQEINVTKTLETIKRLDPEVCQQVIYFSTASILNHDNQLLPEAGAIGTNYVRTKYECCQQLNTLEIASKITVLFPTLVLGGDQTKPYSHLYQGLPDVMKWIDLIRWFKADGSFHFIHGQDIAQIVTYLVENPQNNGKIKKIVLGNKRITVNEAIAQMCDYFNKRIYLQIPLSIGLAKVFIKVFRIQMADWDRFCLNYRHFSYNNPVTPSKLGLKNYCSTIADVLRLRGI